MTVLQCIRIILFLEMAVRKEGIMAASGEKKDKAENKLQKQVILIGNRVRYSGSTSYGTIDAFSVIEAFGVKCPARQQAINMLLYAGDRRQGDIMRNLEAALDAVQRAIKMELDRQSMGKQCKVGRISKGTVS
jgi:hypothetical protein